MTITITRAMCSSSLSAFNTDHLRSQLDQLHSEFDITRRKANNARFRLLRLSEAAENLCRQAAVSVRKGKEDDARELLLQKKKVMLALEKSKGRVELLDELAAKLNEAISIKEAQLVKFVKSDLDVEEDDAEGPVHIVSPTQDNRMALNDDYNVTFNQSDAGEDQELVRAVDSEENVLSYIEGDDAVPERINGENEVTLFSNFGGPSSFIDFLEDLDRHLHNIENDLITVLDVPALVQVNEEKPNSSKDKQLEILENIRGARARIHKYVQNIAGNR